MMGAEEVHKSQDRNSGAAVLMVLICISLLLITGSSFLSGAVREYVISENLLKKARACYYAESGILMAFSLLMEKGEDDLDEILLSFAEGEAGMEVWIYRISEEDRLITSTGTYDKAREKVEALVTIDNINNEIFIKKWMRFD